MSDNFPVYLEWDDSAYTKNYPFKFNKAWLPVDSFARIVLSSWSSDIPSTDDDHKHILVMKLKRLKYDLKIWEKKQKLIQGQELIDLDHEIQQLFSLSLFGIFPKLEFQKLVSINKRKEEILAHEVLTRILKSRAL